MADATQQQVNDATAAANSAAASQTAASSSETSAAQSLADALAAAQAAESAASAAATGAIQDLRVKPDGSGIIQFQTQDAVWHDTTMTAAQFIAAAPSFTLTDARDDSLATVTGTLA